jgi:hypothetical protein
MSYVVLSTDATGQPKLEDVESLDDALQLVERLRNDDHVDAVRVLREVPIEVKTYYKVVALEGDATGGAGEVAPTAAPPVDASLPADGTSAPAAPDLSSEPDVAPAFFTPPPVRSHPIDEDAAPDEDPPSERRTSLFGRG